MDRLKQDIVHLSTLISPSGYEGNVIASWRRMIARYVDSTASTATGDCIAIKDGESTKTIMVVAHADEIGLIISKIDVDKQIAYFDEIGGIDTKLLLGRVVEFVNSHGEVVTGVIGSQPIHCQPRFGNDDTRKLEPQNLWIDFGNNIQNISIGDYGVIADRCIANSDTISGKAMDNRVGLAIMIEVARLIKDHALKKRVCFVASTMEEIGARGVRTAVNSLSPSQCIVIDMALATDTPFHNKPNSSSISLGDGAVVTVGPNLDKTITNQLKAIAEKGLFKYQIDVVSRPTGTDANPVQIMQNGIPCGLVGVPCRYMHTPVETINVCDAKSAANIISNYILNL